MIYQIAKMFRCRPEDIWHYTPAEALLWHDMDKYSGHMERERMKRIKPS